MAHPPEPAPPPPRVVKQFAVTAPVFVTETPRARIWRVTRHDGAPAALKLYHAGTLGDEAPGFAWLRTLNGQGAATLFATTEDAALLEWLDGPHLGDLSRAGPAGDTDAMHILVDLARTLHAKPQAPSAAFPTLERWFEALFAVSCTPDCPPDTRIAIGRCQMLARRLLTTQERHAVLHGDLHHDNIRGSARGYLAFDAHGVCAEPAFELSNAFRNPEGAPDLVTDPARHRRFLALGAAAFGTEITRLAAWAAVRQALSMAWRAKGQLGQDAEAPILHMFLAVLDALTQESRP